MAARSGLAGRAFGWGPRLTRGQWLLIAVAALQVLLLLTTLDRWAYNNDQLHNIGLGLQIDGRDPDLRRLHLAGLANCAANAAPAERLRCERYQGVMLQNHFLNHLLPNLGGWVLHARHDPSRLLEQAGHAVVWTTLAGVLLAALLFVLLLWGAPASAQLSAAIVIGAAGVYQKIAGKAPLALGEPIVWRSWLGLALLAAVAALGAWAIARWRASPPDEAWLKRLLLARPALAAAFLLALLLMLARAAGLEREAVQLAALAAFALLFLAAVLPSRLPVLVAVAAGLALLGFVNDDHLLTTKSSGMQGALLFAGLIAYATVRPQGRLVWLMPATLLFQLSAGGLTALQILVAEAVLCLRRRRLSPLLGAALATVIPAVLYTLMRPASPLTSVSGEHLAAALELVRASPLLPPSLAGLAATGAAALLLLRPADGRWDGLARLVLLLGAVAVTNMLAAILYADPANQLRDGLFVLGKLDTYSATALSVGGAIGLLALLRQWLRSAPDAAPAAPPAAPPRRDPRWGLAVAAFLCLLAAKAPPASSSRTLEGWLQAPAMAFLGAMPTQWPRLAVAAGDDDDYLLDAAEPVNGAMSYFSLLKLKLRKTTGLFRPEAMRVLVLERDGRLRPLEE